MNTTPHASLTHSLHVRSVSTELDARTAARFPLAALALESYTSPCDRSADLATVDAVAERLSRGGLEQTRRALYLAIVATERAYIGYWG